MATYLDRILEHHRARAQKGQPAASLVADAAAAPPPRDFAGALSAQGLSVIAECKRRSPSLGPIDLDLDPASLAKEYVAGGASALSVLTDVEFFGGSPEDLVSARAGVEAPVLRKDFTVCESDVYEARAMGADAVLLIVAALDQSELSGLLSLSSELGMAALVEVHDEVEMDVALGAGAAMVGVNQRDLFTFVVDPGRALRMAYLIPPGVVSVAESGIGSPRQAAALEAAGYDAVLVGEHLLRSDDRRAAVRALAGGSHPRAGE